MLGAVVVPFDNGPDVRLMDVDGPGFPLVNEQKIMFKHGLVFFLVLLPNRIY